MRAPRATSSPVVSHPHLLCDPATSTIRLTPQAGQPPQSDRHRRSLDAGDPAQRPGEE